MGRTGWALTRLGLCVGLLVGCSHSTLGTWQGPSTSAQVTTETWTFGEKQYKVLNTQHYRIYTTITDDEVLDMIVETMEGANSIYQQLAPGVTISTRRMDCYIFRWRSEYDAYTAVHGGADAGVYLQIRSGGYTIRDQYVAHYTNRTGMVSVAAHEGWHQWAGRHFRGRLPPFFEEGLSCMFETVSFRNNLPQWNLSLNGPRAESLKKAIDTKSLLPLEALCSMHAGDIVGEKNEKIDAFYAQCWAFARFLWEGENGKYRPLMQKWISETADGTVKDPTRTHARAIMPWRREAVRPMIEHYLGADIATVDKAYQAYIRTIAREELAIHRRGS